MSTDAVADHRLRRAVCADAAARAGRHGDGPRRRVSGFAYLVGGSAGAQAGRQTSMRTVTDYTFGVIPMFLLMGAFVSQFRHEPRAVHAPPTRLSAICAAVSASPRSPPAAALPPSAAPRSRRRRPSPTVAYPEMRRYGYPQSFATGVIAAGGTLGAMLPPSTVLAVYGIITEQDIGKLFIAGIIPGMLAMCMYIATIAIIGCVRPGFLPAGAAQHLAASAWPASKEIWAPLLLFVFVIGGLYGCRFCRASRRPKPAASVRAALS